MKKFLFNLITTIILSTSSYITYALSFNLPANGDGVVGQVKVIQVTNGENLHQIARENDLGIDQLKLANPRINPDEKIKRNEVIIPAMFVLPPQPWQGIIINLAEKRLYYFPPDQNVVYTFPVGVGQLGWATPTGQTYVYEKIKDPVWTVPDSIMKSLASKGIYVPKKILPGPDDPLGSFALRLAIPGYLVHGTNAPDSIGMRSSSGCIRMYPEDIAALFNLVSRKTPVRIINEPYKLGWNQGSLYLEVYKPLADVKVTNGIDQTPAAVANPLGMDPTKTNAADSDKNVEENPFAGLADAIQKIIVGKQANVNDTLAQKIIDEQNGIPQIIGTSALPTEPAQNTTSPINTVTTNPAPATTAAAVTPTVNTENNSTVTKENINNSSPVLTTSSTPKVYNVAPVQDANDAQVTVSQGLGK